MFLDLLNLGEVVLLGDSVDFRKGIYGLSLELEDRGYSSFTAGDIYIFLNRAKRGMKILYCSSSGFELFYKKVPSVFKLSFPLKKDVFLSKEELKNLLLGYWILEEGFTAQKGSNYS